MALAWRFWSLRNWVRSAFCFASFAFMSSSSERRSLSDVFRDLAKPSNLFDRLSCWARTVLSVELLFDIISERCSRASEFADSIES